MSIPFVGRAVELAQVEALLEVVRSGRGGGLLVVGAAGVGKTRLLAQAASAAGDRDLRVGASACLPLTAPLPFDPLLAVLRALGEPVTLPANRSPRDMFGEVLARFEALVSQVGPVLLCVDDLQWSDAGTLELVHYCLARLSDLPIGWVLAARPAAGSGLLAHRLERAGLVERIELGALSGTEMRLLAEGMVGRGRVSDELADFLFESTGGNPLLCEQLLRALPAGGADQGAPMPRVPSELVPEGVIDTVRERAERLAPGLRAALGWAAVLPIPFTYLELELVGGPGAGSAPEALAREGFLASDGGGGWSFVHAIVRDAVYEELPKHERLRRHGIVADALAGGPLGRLAPQLANAGRWAKAARAYLVLAETALDRAQGEDAAGLYQRAGELAEAGGEELLGRRARAGRVLSLVRAGDREQAQREALRVRADLRATGELDERLEFLGRYAVALFHNAWDLDGAREVLAEAAPLIELASSAKIAEVLAVRAAVRYWAGDTNGALADGERAAEISQATDDVALQARALNALGAIVGNVRDAGEGIAILQTAVQQATAAGLVTEIARARVNLAVFAEAIGDIDGMRTQGRLGLELDGLPAPQAANLHSIMGGASAHLGDLHRALAHTLTARRLAQRAGPQTEAIITVSLAYIHLYRGEVSAARRLLETRNPGITDIRVAEIWGLLLEQEGSAADALASFQQAADAGHRISIWCIAGVARTAVAIGKLDLAREALMHLEQMTEHWPSARWLREEARGWVAVAEGRTDHAITAFHAAADTCPRAHAATRLRLEGARLARNRDRILEAITAFEQMGSARDADRARAIARTLGMRPGRRQARSGPLSAREEEIAQLVAAGQTNREIAATVHLSPRTVERHVSNILTKLGYRSRVQIASDAAAGRLPGGIATVPCE